MGRRMIEVGAGCGLTSIYGALRGANVTITDMDIGVEDKTVTARTNNGSAKGWGRSSQGLHCRRWFSSLIK